MDALAAAAVASSPTDADPTDADANPTDADANPTDDTDDTEIKCSRCGAFKPQAGYSAAQWRRRRRDAFCTACSQRPPRRPVGAVAAGAAAAPRQVQHNLREDDPDFLGQLPFPLPGSSCYPVNEFTGNLGSDGRDVPLYWFERLQRLFERFALAIVHGRERGDKENLLHEQFIIRMRWPKDSKSVQKFKDKILRPWMAIGKFAAGNPDGRNARLYLRAFDPRTQDWGTMVHYPVKMGAAGINGAPPVDYRQAVWAASGDLAAQGLSEEDMAAARERYITVSLPL
jgi:hypothetical protein